MEPDHAGKIKAFSHLGEKHPSDYPDDGIDDQIEVSLREENLDKDKGYRLFTFTWYTHEKHPSLEIDSDSWDLLNTFSDLLICLAKADKTLKPNEMCKLLLSLGIEDWTHKP